MLIALFTDISQRVIQGRSDPLISEYGSCLLNCRLRMQYLQITDFDSW
jgi:hypothetical protein